MKKVWTPDFLWFQEISADKTVWHELPARTCSQTVPGTTVGSVLIVVYKYYFWTTRRNLWIRPSITPFFSKISCAWYRLGRQPATEKPGNSHWMIRANQTSAPTSPNLIGRYASSASSVVNPFSSKERRITFRYCLGNGRGGTSFNKSSASSLSFSAPTCSVNFFAYIKIWEWIID